MRSKRALGLLLIAGWAFTPWAQETPKPVNRYQVVELLVNGVPSERVTTLVAQRGIDFQPTDQFLEIVQVVGGDEPLMAGLRGAKVDVPTNAARKVDTEEAEAAEQNLRDSLSKDSGNAGLHFALGWVLMTHKQGDDAIAELQQAQLLKPDSAAPHILLGEIYIPRKQWDTVKEEFEAALRLKPDDVWAHAYYAGALHLQGDKPGAVKLMREAVRLKPNDPDAHVQLGLRLMDAPPGGGKVSDEDRDAAIIEFRKAAELRPDWYLAHENLGLALERKQDFNGALEEYTTACHLRPDMPFLHVHVGKMLEKKGDRRAALEEYRKAHDLAPNNPAFQRDYERLSRQVDDEP